MPEVRPEIETFAKIKVIGVGGSGGSAINRMIESKIRGVEFIVMNTDVQALHHSKAPTKLHIGKAVTRGLGAGMDPDIGYRAAEESQAEIQEMLKGADMVFITCGLGGGTGSGAGPKVAEIARELGALTVAVVTRPFTFEGSQRRAIADQAHEKLAEMVDTIITIPNDRVLQIIDRKTSLMDAFEIVDDVLRQGVQGISEIITAHGLINVDFADVRSIMANRGSAIMGIGRGQGENRAADAAKSAIASPLLEASIDGAKGILFTVTGGSNLAMFEVSEAAKVITQSADPSAKVIFGVLIDEALKDEMKITVIATGFETRPMKKAVGGGVYNMRQPEAMEQLPFGGRASMPISSRPAPSYVPEPRVQPPTPSYQSEARPTERQSAQEVIPPPPMRAPDPSPSAVQPHVQAPTYAPIQQPRPPAPQPQRVATPKTEEEELEIPAFIRKKMM